MGTNNKARRAAKSRQKTQHGTPRSRGERTGSGRPSSYGDAFGAARDDAFIDDCWVSAFAQLDGDVHEVPAILRDLMTFPADLVETRAQELLVALVGRLWSRGWQPAEVRRQVRIVSDARVAGLADLVIHADHAGRSGQGLDPRWAEQVAALGGREHSTRDAWLSRWRDREGLSRTDAYEMVVTLGRLSGELPPLDILIPPPGARSSTVTVGLPARSAGHHPMLERIRKLLAKAEATDFEEEAATFTAKAQELMTRHAIDEALLHHEDRGDVPRMIRVPLDAPYADAKGLLLAVVATANRCRSVQLARYHMSSVLGHGSDLAVVEMLFTSLLIQAQKAMVDAGRGQAGRRARSASFRSSFLLAYAGRIAERLASVNESVLDPQRAAAALPVLRSREDAVEEFLQDRYGDSLTSSVIRGGHDYLGRAHGRQAADAARLDAGQLTG
ncbi:DUF2786 domain-containing protein [Nocardioides sp. AN3]